MGWSTGSAQSARAAVGSALGAWAGLSLAVEQSVPEELMDSARAAVAAVLTPARAAASRPTAAGRFAEQMTADVASLGQDERQPALAELGQSALPFVQAVWTVDMSTRASHAFDEVFAEEIFGGAGEPVTPGGSAEQPWPALERFLREVAMLTALDPVTSELVRLRGARAHACRLCKSLRSRRAVMAAGDESLFESVDHYEASELPERHKVALRLVDAFIWQPLAWPGSLAPDLRDHYGPAEAAEMILDIVRNSANKIPVALATDDPHLENGVEYYDIDYSSGDVEYGLSLG